MCDLFAIAIWKTKGEVMWGDGAQSNRSALLYRKLTKRTPKLWNTHLGAFMSKIEPSNMDVVTA